MDIAEETGQLHLNRFPVGLRKKLKMRAAATDVTFREVVIQALAEWCEAKRDKRDVGAGGGDGDELVF